MGGDHLLEQLPTALEEGDRPVHFSSGVVRFMGFGYDDDRGSGPGVNAHLQGFP